MTKVKIDMTLDKLKVKPGYTGNTEPKTNPQIAKYAG